MCFYIHCRQLGNEKVSIKKLKVNFFPFNLKKEAPVNKYNTRCVHVLDLDEIFFHFQSEKNSKTVPNKSYSSHPIFAKGI